jgi:hypothetical protein
LEPSDWDGVLWVGAVPSAAHETSALAEVLGRERRLRDRNTQLLVPGKSFKRVLDILVVAQVHSPLQSGKGGHSTMHASGDMSA